MTTDSIRLLAISLLVAVMLTGCTSNRDQMVTITSIPSGATVSITGFDEAFSTPTTVRVPSAGGTTLTFWDADHSTKTIRLPRRTAARKGAGAPDLLTAWGFSTVILPVLVLERPSLAVTWLKFTLSMPYLVPHAIAAELIPKRSDHVYVHVNLRSGRMLMSPQPIPDDGRGHLLDRQTMRSEPSPAAAP